MLARYLDTWTSYLQTGKFQNMERSEANKSLQVCKMLLFFWRLRLLLLNYLSVSWSVWCQKCEFTCQPYLNFKNSLKSFWREAVRKGSGASFESTRSQVASLSSLFCLPAITKVNTAYIALLTPFINTQVNYFHFWAAYAWTQNKFRESYSRWLTISDWQYCITFRLCYKQMEMNTEGKFLTL